MILLNIIIIIAVLMGTSAAQDPVVTQRCVSSSGDREVNCTSKRDNLQFSWSLNGKSLPTDIKPSPAGPAHKRSSSTVTVSANHSGNLTCVTHVSARTTNASILLKDCQAAAGLMYTIVIIAAASFLFLIALSVCFFLLFKTPGSRGVNTGTSDADEVTYADVKIQMGQRTREFHHAAETVEYGQVRVHQQSHD